MWETLGNNTATYLAFGVAVQGFVGIANFEKKIPRSDVSLKPFWISQGRARGFDKLPYKGWGWEIERPRFVMMVRALITDH